jgi:hypothetical protein
MNSLILRATSRLILPAALIFSVYVLLRGHDNPGGGFIGGLIAAAPRPRPISARGWHSPSCPACRRCSSPSLS